MDGSRTPRPRQAYRVSRTLQTAPSLLAFDTFDTIDILDALVQDLVDVCRSPLAATESEVGQATLAMAQVTATVSRVAHPGGLAAAEREQIHAAMEQAREAVDNARRAIETSRRTRDRAAELTGRAIHLRLRAVSQAALPPLLRAWTTVRDVEVGCPACAKPVRVRYRYRFVDGLAARELGCPHPSCEGVLTYYCPVDSVDLSAHADH
jgi:hypothetical protein